MSKEQPNKNATTSTPIVWTVRFGKDDTERFPESAFIDDSSSEDRKRKKVTKKPATRRPDCIKYKLKTGTLYLYHPDRRVEFVRRV